MHHLKEHHVKITTQFKNQNFNKITQALYNILFAVSFLKINKNVRMKNAE